MEKTRTELQHARKEIQRSNHLVAGTGKVPTTVDLTEPEEIQIDDTDTVELMEKVQKVLHSCAKTILTPERPAVRAVSVPSEDENMEAPPKRPRSVEPASANTSLAAGTASFGCSTS